MVKVRVNLERSICVGKHGGFLLTQGEREYHDDVARAIVVAGFGEYVDRPIAVEPIIEEPVVIMQDEPAIEEKQHIAPENKMMDDSPENKSAPELVADEVIAEPELASADPVTEDAPVAVQPVRNKNNHQHRRGR